MACVHLVQRYQINNQQKNQAIAFSVCALTQTPFWYDKIIQYFSFWLDMNGCGYNNLKNTKFYFIENQMDFEFFECFSLLHEYIFPWSCCFCAPAVLV